MKRNPHPARGSRITTLGVSATAFVSIVSSLAWNTHQAELVANIADANTVPVQQVTPSASTTTPTVASVTPAATIAPTAAAAPAAPAKKSSAPAPSKKTKTSAPAAAPAAPTTPTTAPAAPAPSVVYTCMSPGGKTENPTASGKCKNAKYGYVLTKI